MVDVYSVSVDVERKSNSEEHTCPECGAPMVVHYETDGLVITKIAGMRKLEVVEEYEWKVACPRCIAELTVTATEPPV